jgi:hypothetical protein
MWTLAVSPSSMLVRFKLPDGPPAARLASRNINCPLSFIVWTPPFTTAKILSQVVSLLHRKNTTKAGVSFASDQKSSLKSLSFIAEIQSSQELSSNGHSLTSNQYTSIERHRSRIYGSTARQGSGLFGVSSRRNISLTKSRFSRAPDPNNGL